MEPIERASRAEIVALQGRLLRAQVENAWKNVPFYRQRWEAAGVRPEEIQTPADIVKLPLVTKEDFDQDLLENPPFGSYQGNANPVRIHASSGTTGAPKPFFHTQADLDRIAELSARRLRAQGVTPSDLVQVTLPFSLYIGGPIAIEGAMKLGAGVLATGTGAMTPSRRQIEIARLWRTTVLVSTPSYALRLAEVARDMGLDPARDFHLKMMYVTAEFCSPETRQELERSWNTCVYDNYGSVEAPASTYECHLRNGWHISEDAYIFEIVDPETTKPVPPGEEGMLLITSLFREASPFFRYRVGDIVSLRDKPCACGRTFQRMSEVKGRADEMVKLRGVSVYPKSIESVLRTIPELGVEWRLVEEQRGSVQEVSVEVEAVQPLSSEEQAKLANSISEQLKHHLGIRPEVRIFDPGTLISEEAVDGRVKARRLVKRTQPSPSPGDTRK
ncbi:MAG: phenylacetate--CoA ligase family protein [Terriglobia bacterium]